MSEVQALSGRTKKLLALFVAAVVLLAATAGLLWPSSDPKPANPTATNTEAKPETEPEPETEPANLTAEEAGQPPALTENDQLLTETYGLTLPVSVRAREIILETHELITNFERVNEETKEFADSTRYSCQQFEAAVDPEGSGPGNETAGILARIIESDIGLEFVDTEDDPDDDEIRIVGDLADLRQIEITAITNLVEQLNAINNDSAAIESRLVDCQVGDSGSNSGRRNDVGQIGTAINLYIINNSSLPQSRSDIEAGVADQLSHYSLEQINAVGSWDGANLPVDGSFDWDDGYGNPPPPSAGVGQDGGYNNVVIINQAQCDDRGRLPLKGSIRQTVVIYRLEGQDGTRCVEV